MKIRQLAGSAVRVGAVALSVVGGFACADDHAPAAQEHWSVDAGTDVLADTGGTGGAMTTACLPALASENLNPRVDVTRPSASQRVVKTSDLFTRFNSVCGQCHVSTQNGGFQAATVEVFVTVFDASRLARIKSDDPSFAMPPPGKPFSSRLVNDPVRVLADYLQRWIDQGRPADVFLYDTSATASDPGTNPYSYSAMTNLGDCVPAKALYASSPSAEMDAKDTLFAAAMLSSELPKDLTETDLTTFDTAALAANGVISFRPTYPLWSDGSGKLRFIRVPKGTSIKFDKDKQTFDIPTNTRFYKTFFREVVDGAGHVSHRKMETRLIVSRPDTVDADGNPTPTGLFGTYVWSDDEMTARLLDVPYRDGSGFADRTAEYVTNEVAYQDVVESIGPGAAPFADRLHDELLDPRHAGLLQHYAIPGSIRCIQCHRGSPSQNFVLGFNPLQIAQRAANTGGVYEPVDADEQNQLQRFIDYGLITGMASPSDVVVLEDSQKPRSPRTPEELKAQAYMIGNCAHCHNPRGYPSLAKPELATVLNFLPRSTPEAGIFEFPLDKMSPVRSRGANQDIPIPYITPSLRDYPVADESLSRVDNGASLQASTIEMSVRTEVTWSPKYDPAVEGSHGAAGCDKLTDPGSRAYCGDRKSGRTFVAAPWRSILYRNVDTPFPYFDDYVPFPHMPMNSAGFDCRAPRIMGDWMVGLPALLKPEYGWLSEDALPGARKADGSYPLTFIDAPQPYEEIKPGDDRYDLAVARAKDRINEYHAGVRYKYCQDVLGTDILDYIGPSVDYERHPTDYIQYYPVPDRFVYGVRSPVADPAHPGQYVQPQLGVPYHSEWFDYDPTDSSPWQPRRGPVWEDVLVRGIPDEVPPQGTNVTDFAKVVLPGRRRLTDALQKAVLSDALRTYATTEVGYGLWDAKPECTDKLGGVAKKAGDPLFDPNKGGSRPVWMDEVHPALLPDAPVYMMSPGASLYRHICFNCHGPKADGKGLQGDALAASSEGHARPANLAEGLFGPPETLGANLLTVFGRGTGDPKIADLWGSRYMAWMTLGGTLQLIPHDVINQVEATTIFGDRRKNLSKLGLTETVSANMLNLAKGLCAAVLPDISDTTLRLLPGTFDSQGRAPDDYIPSTSKQAPFLHTNGDWEMWMNLCSVFNRPVIRVYGVRKVGDTGIEGYLKAFYYADDGSSNPSYRFPADAPVWDQNRAPQVGISPKNYYPACFQDPGVPIPGEPPTDLPASTVLDPFVSSFKMPRCPPEFLQHGELLMWSDRIQSDAQVDNLREWSLQGAINAGMSVFSYLEKSDLSHNKIQPYYNECQRLP